MRGMPYVKRTKVWDSSTKTYISGKEIIIGEQTWDGIDNRDYTDKFILNPDQARHVATELWKSAEQIDGKREKQSIIKKIMKNTENIAKQAKCEAMK